MKKKKRDTNRFYKIGFYGILAVLVILITLPAIMPKENSYVCPSTNEIGQLVSYTSDWFINVENQDQIVFFVSLANYGYTNAENVNIACELFQTNTDGALIDNIPEYTTTLKLDEVKNTQTTEVEVTGLGIKELNQEVPYIGLCKVESCENCEILTERLIE